MLLSDDELAAKTAKKKSASIEKESKTCYRWSIRIFENAQPNVFEPRLSLDSYLSNEHYILYYSAMLIVQRIIDSNKSVHIDFNLYYRESEKIKIELFSCFFKGSSRNKAEFHPL